MPKLLHETLVSLVRAAPRMVVDLLRPVLGEVVANASVEVLPQVTAAELVNLDLPEYRADAVLLLGDPMRPLGAIIVEAQGEPAKRKRRVWPHYMTGFAVRFDCPVMLVVFTLDEEVAAWAREAIDFGFGQGFFRPVVLGLRDIPVITDPAVARASPELAVLSVVAHGREPGAEYIARAALAGCGPLDTQVGLHYADFIAAFLGDIARAALEKLMESKSEKPFYEGAFLRLMEGVVKGKGRVEGKAESLLKMFRLRGWTATPEIEARVLACKDEATIDLWIDRVLTMASLDEVFAA